MLNNIILKREIQFQDSIQHFPQTFLIIRFWHLKNRDFQYSLHSMKMNDHEILFHFGKLISFFFYSSGSTLSDETYESLIYFLSFHLETDHSITDAQEAELNNRVRGGKRYSEVSSKQANTGRFNLLQITCTFMCSGLSCGYIDVCNYLELKSPHPPKLRPPPFTHT